MDQFRYLALRTFYEHSCIWYVLIYYLYCQSPDAAAAAGEAGAGAQSDASTWRGPVRLGCIRLGAKLYYNVSYIILYHAVVVHDRQ